MYVIQDFFDTYLKRINMPQMELSDMIDILLIAIVIYYILKFIKNTRAWMLLKGILFLMLVVVVATVFRFNTVLWIFDKTINVGVIALAVIFQPELRSVLEKIGSKNFLNNVLTFDDNKGEGYITQKTIGALVFATFQMAKVKTGALIVVEKDIVLSEYEKTGISIDAVVSSQLIMNTFVNKTPLHDGAVIVRGNRIVAATCYLPLTGKTNIAKELGTRHRAALGISEVSDSMTIIVSEETGQVSLAMDGVLIRNVDEKYLENKLEKMQEKVSRLDKRMKERVKVK